MAHRHEFSVQQIHHGSAISRARGAETPNGGEVKEALQKHGNVLLRKRLERILVQQNSHRGIHHVHHRTHDLRH